MSLREENWTSAAFIVSGQGLGSRVEGRSGANADVAGESGGGAADLSDCEIRVACVGRGEWSGLTMASLADMQRLAAAVQAPIVPADDLMNQRLRPEQPISARTALPAGLKRQYIHISGR
jgi:hypothetical protein